MSPDPRGPDTTPPPTTAPPPTQSPGPTPSPRSATLARLLIRLYPRAFRDAHGQEMEHLFRVRLGRSTGPVSRMGVWVRLVADTIENAWVLRRRARHQSRQRGEEGAMNTLIHDTRQALRHLLRAPAFGVAAVALLAVGLGANITVFTLVDAMLFRPLPWDDPDRVVMVYQDSDDGEPNSSSFPAYRDMADSDVFAEVSAMSPAFAAITWESPEGPLDLAAEYATASYLDAVGLAPLRGRWFAPEHDRVGSEPVAVISEAAWRKVMGNDPDVVGRVIRLNGQSVRIIGVGPREISGSYPPRTTDLWLSISSTPLSGPFRVSNLDRRSDHWYDVRARLAENTTVEQAQAAMDALAARLAENFPEFNRGRDITVFRSSDVRIHPGEDGSLFLIGGLLLSVVVVVLLLTCANLANLLLVRGLGRSGEMAIRRALGASRLRVARLFLLESMILAVAGGVAGLALARWAVGMIPSLPIPVPGWDHVELLFDTRVVLFAGGLVVVTGVLFGLAPAVRSAGADVAGSLRDERRGSSMGGATRRLRDALVVVQVAASLVLVLGTGLLARSLSALQSLDPGLDADRVAWVRADLGRAGLEADELRIAVDEMIENVESMPGVTGAAVTTRLPAQGGGSTTTVVEDYTPPTGTDAVELAFAVVSAEYFRTLGVPVVAGRTFGPDDSPDGPASIMVNEAAARRFWGGAQQALGRRTRSQGGSAWRTVVGVVGDSPVSTLSESTRPIMYFFSGQRAPSSFYVVTRTDGDPSALLSPVREGLAALRSSVNITGQGTLAGWLGEGLAAPRFAAGMMGAFSLLALLLAGLGIYAVVAFSVARRTAELGIRIALGAGRDRVTRMVVREVVGTVGLGVLAGLVLARLAATRLDGLLFGVNSTDPLTFLGAAAFLVTVGVVAAWVPARRAARTDPVEAMRGV